MDNRLMNTKHAEALYVVQGRMFTDFARARQYAQSLAEESQKPVPIQEGGKGMPRRLDVVYPSTDKAARFAYYDYSFVVFSDVYGRPEIRHDIFEAISELGGFVVFCGDWDKTPSPEGLAEMREMLDEYFDHWMATPGNHEVTWVDGEPSDLGWYITFIGEPNQHEVINGDHFIALSSAMGEVNLDIAERMLEEARLTGGRIFVFTHMPPVDTIPQSENEEDHAMKNGDAFMWLMEQYNVSAVFSSHQHGYEVFERDGVLYVTTAGGGSAPLDEPEEQPHFVQVYVGEGIRLEKQNLYPPSVDV